MFYIFEVADGVKVDSCQIIKSSVNKNALYLLSNYLKN